MSRRCRSTRSAPALERTLTMRGRIEGAVRSVSLAAVVSVAGDAERRNDTLATAVQVAPAAGAVFVSTSPDFDARFCIPVLRGAVALPTRAFLSRRAGHVAAGRHARGRERGDGARGAAEAPLAIIHGDTAVFGAPRAVTNGSLALYRPVGGHDRRVVSDRRRRRRRSRRRSRACRGTASRRSASRRLCRRRLDGARGASPARSEERRVAIAGTREPRRVAIVGASGLWRWRFRGGVSARRVHGALGRYLRLAGGGARGSPRAALPDERSCAPAIAMRWRRGSGRHARVASRCSGAATTRVDSLTLRFERRGRRWRDAAARRRGSTRRAWRRRVAARR